MHKTTAKSVETWDLGEMLAALCRVAQDAASAEAASQSVENPGMTREFPTTEEGVCRP
jgi:hypothetical protein